MEKHLELIQGAINRLANSSFLYKGWAVTVTAGLVAFLIDRKVQSPFAGLYPIIAFWFLDSHALACERAFRKLYELARKGKIEMYSMDISVVRRPFMDQMDAMLSISMSLFYGAALVCVILTSAALA